MFIFQLCRANFSSLKIQARKILQLSQTNGIVLEIQFFVCDLSLKKSLKFHPFHHLQKWGHCFSPHSESIHPSKWMSRRKTDRQTEVKRKKMFNVYMYLCTLLWWVEKLISHYLQYEFSIHFSEPLRSNSCCNFNGGPREIFKRRAKKSFSATKIYRTWNWFQQISDKFVCWFNLTWK